MEERKAKAVKKKKQKLIQKEKLAEQQQKEAAERIRILEEIQKAAEEKEIQRCKHRYLEKGNAADEQPDEEEKEDGNDVGNTADEEDIYHPPPDLIHFVTPTMKSRGRAALIKNPKLLRKKWVIEKIVDKGIDQESKELMYLVKWEHFRQKTWEFARSLQEDGAFLEINKYEVRHFTNEVAAQSSDKSLLKRRKERLNEAN